MSRKIVLGVVAAGTAAACAFLIGVLVHKGLADAALWAGLIGALAAVLAVPAALLVMSPAPRPSLTPGPEPPEWAVGRPAELDSVVSALVGGRAGAVGITTSLYGAGGFGKTTLAQMACADRRVRRRFEDRVHWVTVGRELQGPAAVAAKVNDVIRLVFDVDAAFTDPQLAGARLGALLASGPRRLLVLDDVWDTAQLAPFTMGGEDCVRMVTTRVPELLSRQDIAVRVDQMTMQQARAVLTAGLPALDEAAVTGLLAVTGRWPLLLRLVNKVLADYARISGAAAVSAQATALLGQLAVGGPRVVDDLRLDGGRGLDVGRPEQRAEAVRATIAASTGLLDRSDAERFAELGVFAEDEIVPFRLVASLWRATAGLDDLRAAQVCRRLAQLALVMHGPGQGGGITLHDVIRDFLRDDLGERRLAALNDAFLAAFAAGLPAADPLADDGDRVVRTAWWELEPENRYLWDHLIEHLRDAGRPGEAEAVACDLRWVGARLERFGPAGPVADLAAAVTRRTVRLRGVIERTAHLLAPTDPPGAVLDILHARVAADSDWGPQVTVLDATCTRSRLISLCPLPDLPDPALRRVLAGHAKRVVAVAVSPDGGWLATASDDRTARIWDATTGRERAVLRGHDAAVTALAVSPDGGWLATASDDRTARIWDAATGREHAVLSGHASRVVAVAVSPDGSWLATASNDRTARIWNAATGRERAVLKGHSRTVTAVAVSPDGSWLATASNDRTVRIWDAASGRERAGLRGHTGPVTGVVVSPDGGWLATASDDGTVRIWDTATGRERSVLKGWGADLAVMRDGAWLATTSWEVPARIWDTATGRERLVLKGRSGGVRALAVSPDGSWLASAGWDETARIWDTATGDERSVLSGHSAGVAAMAAAPDGSWLATASDDGTARIWDTITGNERSAPHAHSSPVTALAAAPDGSWLAAGGGDGAAGIWDTVTGRRRLAVDARSSPVTVVAVAPDGSSLAAGSDNGIAGIWDAVTGRRRAALNTHTSGVTAVAFSPDGSWLATASWDQTARIWDARTGREHVVLGGHAGGVVAAAFSPDGSWLATASHDNTARIWDAATGRGFAVLDGHSSLLTAVAFSPDGSWLATASWDQTARIWDARTGRARAVLDGHRAMVTAVAFSPDGRWLATVGGDDTARIWDTATGTERSVLNTSHLVAVAFSPDGSWLATASGAGEVRIWDTGTGLPEALMRVDGTLFACTWLSYDALALGGSAGLYLLRFLHKRL